MRELKRRRGDIGEGREPQARMASEDEEWGRWRYIRRVLLASERARRARCVSAAAAVARGYFQWEADEEWGRRPTTECAAAPHSRAVTFKGEGRHMAMLSS